MCSSHSTARDLQTPTMNIHEPRSSGQALTRAKTEKPRGGDSCVRGGASLTPIMTVDGGGRGPGRAGGVFSASRGRQDEKASEVGPECVATHSRAGPAHPAVTSRLLESRPPSRSPSRKSRADSGEGEDGGFTRPRPPGRHPGQRRVTLCIPPRVTTPESPGMTEGQGLGGSVPHWE